MGTISGEELARWENVDDGSGGKEERILVSVRLRPLNDKEIERNDPSDWECVNTNTIIFKNSLPERSMFPTAYTFDRVFGYECSTRNVYDEGAKEVALSVLNGINSSIFAYGQTSSGKTYTMTGITDYCVTEIYDYIEKHQEREFVLKFSAIEIYNEAVRDLLSADTTPLRLLDDPEKGTIIEKLAEETLRDHSHFQELLAVCEAQRQIGETALNEMSSRSHQILRLTVESSARQISSRDTSSTLIATVNFVDLAGSERASQASSAGTRLKEGCHINRSLLTLGTVVRKLSKGRNGHVPYRDSKLTRILQSSLGGNARTAIICTLSPARSHVEQSRNTLLFASCAKEISTNAQVNVVMSDKALVKRLQRELAKLENELKYPGSVSCSFHSEALKEKDTLIKKMEREMKELIQQRDLAQSRLEDLLLTVRSEQNSRQWDESSESSAIHAHNLSEDAILNSVTSVVEVQSSYHDSARLETSSESNLCNQEQQELSDNLKEQEITSARQSNNNNTSMRKEEIADTMSVDSEEHCREVRCIEVHSVSTNKSDKPNLLSTNENDHQTMTEENVVGDYGAPFTNNATPLNSAQERPVKHVTSEDDDILESYSKPSVEKLIDFEAEKPIKKVASAIVVNTADWPSAHNIPSSFEKDLKKTEINKVHSFVSSPNDKSQNPPTQKSMNSRELALTRSSSCRANLITTSNYFWFDDVEEDNKTPPNEFLKEFSGRSGKIQRRISAMNFDAENDKVSVEGSEVSDRLSSIPTVSSMQDIQSVTQEQLANFSFSLGGVVNMDHIQNPNQLADDEEAQDTKVVTDDRVDTDVKDVCSYPMLSSLDSISKWPMEFERKQQDIIKLWHACNISLVHRTCFFLLFKGDPADSFYIEVEFRRLSFLRNTTSNGRPDSMVEDGHKVALASSMRHLRRERDILYQQLLRQYSPDEKIVLYKKWGIDVNSKQRRMQLSRLVWTKTDIEHVRESASLVAKLIGVLEQGHALKEMFGLSFTPQQPNNRRSFSWKHGKPPLV